MKRELFMSFEGTEGAGKTTQIRALATWLQSAGRSVLTVREPGGTDLSEQIRELLLRRDAPRTDPWAELFLYEAARVQLVAEKIRPALEAGVIVLADRFSEASEAYQGAGRRLGMRRVRSLNRWATGGLRPDRVFLLDLDPEVGLERIRRGRGGRALDRLEAEPLSFHRRIRRAYLSMAAREPERFRVLDASAPSESIEIQIRNDVAATL